ncbi:MAG: LacI family DNA-binding transcriptional regulator [Actinomycetota bacterium]
MAARAGVDPSVVSRLINKDDRLKISPETRERVLAAIADVGYQPNMAARGLRVGRTYLMGLLVPDFANPVYAEMIRGVQDAADEAGYSVILGGAGDERHGVDLVRSLLEQQRVDGLLVASGVESDPALDEIARRDHRILIMNRKVPGAPSAVVLDDAAGARMAVEHLAGLGHQRIGAVIGPAGIETTERRHKGLLDGAAAAGLPEPRVVFAEAATASAGFESAASLLNAHPDITAIFASTILLGVGVLKAVVASGRRVPTDASVIALHNSEFAEYTNPSITTVAMALKEMGEEAFRRLLCQLDGCEEAGDVIVTDPLPRVIQRQSTAPAP